MVVFSLVCEQGVGNMTVNRYTDEEEARAAAYELWWCWVLYQRNNLGTVTELDYGGVGFAHPTIRQHAEVLFNREDRQNEERGAKAEAEAWAEQRASGRVSCFVDEELLVRRMPLSRRAAAAVVFAFKFLQFVDRGVQNGSPTEIAGFIERTTAVVGNQSLLFASLASAYTAGTVAGCGLCVGLLAHGFLPHALLRHGACVWALGVFASALCSTLPDVRLSFVAFLLSRFLVGLGAGGVTVTWPPYIEAVAHHGERSMCMALIETGTALGAAVGFLYSAAMTKLAGWGAAYLLIVPYPHDP
jgi:hypothetical protein